MKIDFVETDLIKNIDKIHTTELGEQRIRKNLSLDTPDLIAWSKNRVENADSISRKGKNWYVNAAGCILTINAYSFTIITAHRKK
ncbi:hypothetical protein LAD12857_18360 [Lacrimispora amygdalina]|uniref:DUF3781 domain-containing protein n=1 Tax=Lacrimispora amygdalina TaxID=253257 RepID=A0A3E2NDT3_9FIRM|nr:DUF3781 domain-containing protein [Clostridium indicum]RFZ79041.1 DUF3781 domain-containing protein [Clostridium indicum]